MQGNRDYKPDSVYVALRQRLCYYGFSEEQADAVLAQQIANDKDRLMEGRWNNRDSDFSPTIIRIFWDDAKVEAVKYIDENVPQHPARSELLTPYVEERLRLMEEAAGNASGSKPSRNASGSKRSRNASDSKPSQG